MSDELSCVAGPTDRPLRNLTIDGLLAQARGRSPDHEAVVSCHQGIRLTYRQLDLAAINFAKGLLQLGLQPGDRIGIWSPNNIEWIVTMYAAAKIGLVLVNLNPAYRPVELEFALNKVACKALVMAQRFKTSAYPEMVSELVPEVRDCGKGHLVSNRLKDLESLIIIGDEARDGFYLFTEVSEIGRASNENVQVLTEACKVDSPVNIQFTSGTTGSPKGATLTHNNVVNNAFFVGEGIALSDQDRLCAPVPLYHCFGMVMGVLACASQRATLVLPDESFAPSTTLQAVASERCTALYGVPTMFSAILNHPEFASYSVASLRTGIVAGSLCPEALMARIISDLHMRQVTNCYGMTETSPVSFQTGIDDDFEKRTTTVGRVHPHVEVKIIDSIGDIVKRGIRGEICTKGYSVMSGYWADDERTRESIVDGWMLTGDEGVLDQDGYCAIVGRIKDTIIRGGENISPKEIEEYLSTHDEILEAQAFGIPDEKFGEIVCAWIIVQRNSKLSEQDVKNFCDGRIAYFKVPAIVRIVSEYPLTVTGKVKKFVMRDAMVAKRRGDEHAQAT